MSDLQIPLIVPVQLVVSAVAIIIAVAVFSVFRFIAGVLR